MWNAASFFRLLLVSALFVIIPGATPSFADPVDIPTGTSYGLPSGPLLLKLDGAKIHLQWDAEEEAAMRYSFRSRETGPRAQLTFLKRNFSPDEILSSDGPGSRNPEETLILHVDLLPGQALKILGRDLEIISIETEMIEDFREDDPDKEESREKKARDGAKGNEGDETSIPLRLEISSSTVHLENLSFPSSIAAENSALEILKPHGSLELEMTGGRLRVFAAKAPIRLSATDGIVDIDSEDSATITLTNTRLSLSGALRFLQCEAVDSYLDLYKTRAGLEISGSGSTFNFNQAHLGRAEIRGDNQNLYLQGSGQILRTTLSRSTVEIPAWKGRIETTLSAGSSFDVGALTGDLLFQISGDSELRLTGITGHLRGQSHDSTMVFHHLKSMEVDIWNSKLSVSDLYEITKLGAVASEVEITAPELRADPKISLQEGSSLDLELPAPCVIELKDPIDEWSSVLDAPNCGIRVNGNLMGNLSRARRGGPRPIEAEVVIDVSSSMQAEVPL